MNKKIKVYALAWIVLVAIFNVIVFVTPDEAAGYTKFGGAFWGAYVFVMLAFVGQLICAYVALKEDDVQKLFYNVPLIRISYSTLILSILIATICFVIPDLPNWVAAVLCVLVLGIKLITLIKAKSGAEIVSNVDQKVKTKTMFIKMLRADAEMLALKTESIEIKDAVNKVVDAIKYSDPMSNDALSDIESQITLKFAELSKSVEEKDNDAVKTVCNELLVLIENRNKKCKLLK